MLITIHLKLVNSKKKKKREKKREETTEANYQKKCTRESDQTNYIYAFHRLIDKLSTQTSSRDRD